MRFRWRAGLVAPASALAALATQGCAVRVGSGGPPPEANTSAADARAPDAHAPTGISSVQSADGGLACALSGAEQKVPFGAGTDAFAFAWDTDHYVVVYVDPSSGNGDVTVATLAEDGTVRMPPVPIESTPASSDLPNLVKTPNGFLVVWEEGSAGESIFVHALAADGSPSGAGTAIGTTTLQLFQGQQARPVLSAAPGGRAAVAWMDSWAGSYGVELALVDLATLAVTGPDRIAPSDQCAWPWLAGDEQGLRMLWSDLPLGTDASAAAYGIDNAAVDATSLAMKNTTPLPTVGPFNAQLGRMIRTGFGYMATWEDEASDNGDNQIEMALVDVNGARVGGGIVEEAHSGDANWPNIAWDGTRSAVVYYQWRDSYPQVFMTLVDNGGQRIGTHDLQVSSGTKGGSKYPDVVWTGSEFGVMYIDTRDGPPELWLQRVACSK
jgi:hypothetical protein